MKYLYTIRKIPIILYLNILLIKAIFVVEAHSETKIKIVKEKEICNNGEPPLMILDNNSLSKGHGQHNYISICPEDHLDKRNKNSKGEINLGKRSINSEIFVNNKRNNNKKFKSKREKYMDDLFKYKERIFNWPENGNINVNENKNENDDNTEMSQQIDIKNPLLKNTEIIKMENEEDENANENKYLNSTSAFVIEFYCYETPNICEKAKRSFESATQKIALAIKVVKPIIVQASLYSFKDIKEESPTDASSIGSAAASAYHILMRNGTRYLYPQPLVKQFNEVSVFVSTDITADFNSDYSFYFAGDEKIEEGQIDYEYVVLHELIHGLGFATAFQKYFSDVIKITDKQDFLTPSLSLVNETYISNWRPIQVFDKNIIATTSNQTFDSYNNAISEFVPSKDTLSSKEYLNEFLASVKPYQAAKAVMKCASNKTGSLVFKANDGSDIVLYTKKDEFIQGSSIAHLDNSFIHTPDFIMISDVSPFQGRTLASMYNEYGKSHPYGALGPNVLKVLNEIGWEIADEPANITRFYVDTVSSATTNSQSILSKIFMTLLIITFIKQFSYIL